MYLENIYSLLPCLRVVFICFMDQKLRHKVLGIFIIKIHLTSNTERGDKFSLTDFCLVSPPGVQCECCRDRCVQPDTSLRYQSWDSAVC